MTFNFTRTADFASTAVEEAFYDDDTRKLAVVLSGGNTYQYDGVPAHEFNAFVNAPSAGRHYATIVKRNYGPGEYLGYGVDFKRGVKAPDMGAVTRDKTFGTITGTIPNASLGTPKGLTLAPDAKVTNVFSGRFPLAQEPVAEQSKFTVAFKDASGQDRTYNTEADSVEDALAGLRDVEDMLDLTFTPTAVTQHLV